MQSIYDVINSYHLVEGLDSEFLVIAESEEHAKQVCLSLLQEDQEMHLLTLRNNIESLEKSMKKQWDIDKNDPTYAFLERANARNLENLERFKKLLAEFHGYKAEYLTVKKINPRLKNGYLQFDDEAQSIKKW